MGLSVLSNVLMLFGLGLIAFVASHFKMKSIVWVFLVIATFLDCFGSTVDSLSLMYFSSFWLVMFLERFAPRNKYELNSAENLKNIPALAFKESLIIGGYFLIPELIDSHFNYSLNLSESTLPTWMQALVAALLADLAIYVIHRSQHKYKFYWKWHKLHHATRELNILADFRTNVIELVLVQVGSRILIFSLLGISPTAAIGAEWLAYTTGGMLPHANINFPPKKLQWLNYLIVTPNIHALHHSIKEQGVNFSETFTIWDILFGTFKMPTEKISDFGIDDEEFTKKNIFLQHLEPFRTAAPESQEQNSGSPHRDVA